MNDFILQLFLKCKHFQVGVAVFGLRRTGGISKDSLTFQVQIVEEEHCVLHAGLDHLCPLTRVWT
jgi:hypothetical protein